MVNSSAAVPLMSIRAMLEGMRAAGLDATHIMRKSGLCEIALVQGNDRVPDSVYQAIWREARRAARDDGIGAAIGAAVPMGMFGVVDYLAASAHTLRESITSTRDLSHLTSDSSFWEVEYGSKGEITARFINVIRNEEDATGDEFAMGALLCRMKALASAPLRLVEVQLTRRKPVSRLAQRFFGHVSYGHAASQLVLGPGTSDIALKLSDPCLHATLRGLLHDAGKDLVASTRTAELVRRSARQLLERSIWPAVHTVSRQLGLSQRTLQRRLMSEGTSFEQVLDDLRRDVAQRRLRVQGGPSVLQVALELGFADERSLARAFHRWTGMSPRQWRSGALTSNGLARL